jgi:hypothetical protein
MNAKLAGFLFLVSASVAGATAATCSEEAEAGLVMSVAPPEGRYFVIRGTPPGQRKIDQAIVLRNGDKIQLVDLETQLTLQLIGKQKDIRISRNNEMPYPVRLERTSEPSAWATLSWFLHELAPREEESRARLTTTHIRGGNSLPRLHLFDRDQQIVAGRRSIAVAWKGEDGASVSVAIALNGQLIARGTTTEQIWISPILDLKPGTYVFELAASGRKSTNTFKVIDPSEMPRTFDDASLDTSEEDLRKTLSAGVLASVSNGAFALEAFQKVVPLAGRSSAAKILYDALIDGAWTEKPP